MSNQLVNIVIKEPIIRRVRIVEQERMQAIAELIENNNFIPKKEGLTGRFVFVMEMIENGQAIFCTIENEQSKTLDTFKLSLKPLRRIIKDYFQMCESYFDAIKKISNAQLETIDMARRAVHNEASVLLVRMLENNVEVDEATARRLFTLISVMNIRG